MIDRFDSIDSIRSNTIRSNTIRSIDRVDRVDMERPVARDDRALDR
jgi:hypothetical protein